MTDRGPDATHDAPVDLSSFGLQDGDERWLALVRAAERPIGLGGVGPYEILDEVRRGGQGVVYRARCTQTGRLVALKRLLAGSLSTPDVRARFDREIEALRALKHPNIVTALSVDGAYDGAMFAMEWVEGSPITTWSAEQRSSRNGLHEIARMLLKVCEAVQHAHQRGLMHRDLKPSNIFIDPRGEPRVLDFGLAKPTPDAGSSAADVTRTDQFVGTVAYASPEQLRGRPEELDIRSDIYSLGVILYEMLTGRRPHATGDNVAAALHAFEHIPVTSPRGLNPLIPRDLEAVTLMALAPDRAARYQSADALAADLRNVLAGTPVTARAYGRWEPLLKTLRRHRLATAFAATVVALLAVFGICAAVFAERFARQRDLAFAAQAAQNDARQHAEREQQKAEAVREFLEDLLAHADPAQAGGRNVTVRDALDAASRSLSHPAAGQEPTHAATHLTLGRTYQNLGAVEMAEHHFRAALELHRGLYGDSDGQTLTALFSLALFLHSSGRAAEARDLAAPVIEHLSDELHNGELPDGADNDTISMVLCILGHGDDAELLYRRTIEADRARHGDVHETVADNISTLASLLCGRGKHAEAEPLQREALALRRTLHGDQHPAVAEAVHTLGTLLVFAGKLEEAEPHLREALALYDALGLRRRLAGATATFELAGLLLKLGRLDEAEPPARESLDIYIELFGPEHLDVAESRARLARILDRRGDHAAAEHCFRDALAAHRAQLKPGHWRTAALEKDLGACLTALGCFEEAESLLLASLENLRTAPSFRRDERRKTLERIVELYVAWDQPTETAHFRELLDQEPR